MVAAAVHKMKQKAIKVFPSQFFRTLKFGAWFLLSTLDHHNFSVFVRSARGQIQSTNKKHLSYLSYTETIKTETKLSAKANEEYKVKMKQQAKNKNKNKQE